jgi:signal transduction histidine kinase/DNA-binding NarL/FixJ family response regulator
MAHSVKKSSVSEAEASKQETQMANLLEQKLRLLSPQSINRLIRNLKIKQKISFGYAIGLGIIISGSLTGLIIGENIHNQANKSRLKIERDRKLLTDLQQSTLSLQLVPGFPLSSNKIVNHEDLKKTIVKQIYRAKTSFYQLNQTADSSSIKGLKPLFFSYSGTFKKFIDNLENSLQKNESRTLRTAKINPSYQVLEDLSKNQISVNTQKLINQVTILIEIAEQQQIRAEAELQHTYVLKWLILLLSLALSIICVYLFGSYISLAIASPMEALLSNIQRVNHQLNLDLQTESSKNDEFTILNSMFNQIFQKLSELQKFQEQVKIDTDIAKHTKNMFLANMTHELRTPLNGILGYAQILSRSQSLTDEQKHGIQTIYQCGFNLLNMINDILDISKIDENKMELSLQDFHLPSLIQGVVEVSRLQSEQKGIDFIYEKVENLPTGICGDQQRLRQVLVNLLNNAIKFTDTGQIKLQVDTTYNLSNVLIHFVVSDTGLGISPEQQKKIFLPFEKLENSHNQTSGAGLGLAISQKIARMMGSEIRLQSQLGIGSIFEFTVEFPISEDWTESSQITANGRLIGYLGHRRKILVIDDNWENRSCIVSLLKPLNFIISEAANGEEGLIKCYESRPDLIISDLEMPVMNGWEFIEKIRKIEDLKDIIIIVSLANRYNYDIDYDNAINIGANDLLPKPVRADKLYLLLAENLQLSWEYGSYDLGDYQEHNTEECSETFSDNQIIIPSISELTALLKYVKKGQIKGIKQELEKIANKDIKYDTFVKIMSKYVRVLNIQKIRNFLQENLQK